MLLQSLTAGLHRLARRPGLVALVYAANLVPALLMALSVFGVLSHRVGPTGFSPELAASFDLVLWADLAETVGALFATLGTQLFWIVPLYVVLDAAVLVGLVHALRGDAVRSFWQGVERYTGRAVLLALLFLLPLIGWLLLVGALVFGLTSLWTGEVGTFWTVGVIGPTLLIAGLAVLDLMRDYAHVVLVVEEEPVLRAWKTGLRWPFRYGASSRLYLVWFVPAALCWATPVFLGAPSAASAWTIWGFFLLRQAVLMLRAAVTVGWLGSEVAFFEHIRQRERLFMAEAAAPSATSVSTA